MEINVSQPVHPLIPTIQHLLKKIDRLGLSLSSHRDIESLLVRQISREIDRALPWQPGHSTNTAALVMLIGQTIGLTSPELHDLRLAALLHDIGLLLLPPHLPTGRCFLDAESYRTLQSHPRRGAELLEPFSFLRKASVLIAHHHEHWDGSGYPFGLRASFIPLGSRILAVGDAFDAIHVDRSLPIAERARVKLRILRVAAGTQFDPFLVERTAQIIMARMVEPASRSTMPRSSLT